MGKRTDEDERRSITIKVRVSPQEKAVIDANARTASRSVSAFMRERSLGLHLGDQVARIASADLRRTAISLHRLAEAAGDEQDEPTTQVLARARVEVMRLLASLTDSASDDTSCG